MFSNPRLQIWLMPLQVDAYKNKFHLKVPLFKDEENTNDVTQATAGSSDSVSMLTVASSRERTRSSGTRFSKTPDDKTNQTGITGFPYQTPIWHESTLVVTNFFHKI